MKVEQWGWCPDCGANRKFTTTRTNHGAIFAMVLLPLPIGFFLGVLDLALIVSLIALTLWIWRGLMRLSGSEPWQCTECGHKTQKLIPRKTTPDAKTA